MVGGHEVWGARSSFSSSFTSKIFIHTSCPSFFLFLFEYSLPPAGTIFFAVFSSGLALLRLLILLGSSHSDTGRPGLWYSLLFLLSFYHRHHAPSECLCWGLVPILLPPLMRRNPKLPFQAQNATAGNPLRTICGLGHKCNNPSSPTSSAIAGCCQKHCCAIAGCYLNPSTAICPGPLDLCHCWLFQSQCWFCHCWLGLQLKLLLEPQPSCHCWLSANGLLDLDLGDLGSQGPFHHLGYQICKPTWIPEHPRWDFPGPRAGGPLWRTSWPISGSLESQSCRVLSSALLRLLQVSVKGLSTAAHYYSSEFATSVRVASLPLQACPFSQQLPFLAEATTPRGQTRRPFSGWFPYQEPFPG